MSALATAPETRPAFHAAPEPSLAPALARWQRVALVIGVIGLALSGVGAFLDPLQAAFAYLFGIVYWTGLSLGMLCILMMHALTNGGWGFVIRRFLEAGSYLLPFMALLFVPIFFGLGYLYPWTDPSVVAHNEAIRFKHLYLNAPMLAVRTVVAFGFWSVAAWLLNRWSFAQDEHARRLVHPADARAGPRRGWWRSRSSRRWPSSTGSWCLEKDWFSTVFAPQVIIGQILVAFAFCAVLLSFVRPYLTLARGGQDRSIFIRWATFLLAFTMMWAYLAVSQLIIIWSGNLPHEIEWYLHRVAGTVGSRWQSSSACSISRCRFSCCSGARTRKISNVSCARLAVGIILFVHAVEVFWQIEPSHAQRRTERVVDARRGVSRHRRRVVGGVPGPSQKPRATCRVNDPRFKEAIIRWTLTR